MKITLTFKPYGESQPAPCRSVLLLLSGHRHGADATESTAFLTEHPTAGWLWHFHDTRLHPRQPDKNDLWAYYPNAAPDVPKRDE